MRISLSEAIERYQREPGAPGNAYDWYRRSAQRSNRVWIHDHTIPAVKVGWQWMVEEADLNAALAALGEARARQAQRTADYERRLILQSGHGAHRRPRVSRQGRSTSCGTTWTAPDSGVTGAGSATRAGR